MFSPEKLLNYTRRAYELLRLGLICNELACFKICLHVCSLRVVQPATASKIIAKNPSWNYNLLARFVPRPAYNPEYGNMVRDRISRKEGRIKIWLCRARTLVDASRKQLCSAWSGLHRSQDFHKIIMTLKGFVRQSDESIFKNCSGEQLKKYQSHLSLWKNRTLNRHNLIKWVLTTLMTRWLFNNS